jgi:general secretion pathway protein K
MSPGRTHRNERERGVALLLVLWIFMILGVLALDFSRYMRDDAMAAVNFAEETRGYYVALAGMNRTIFEAQQARDQALGAPAAEDPGAPDVGTDDEDDDRIPADGQWHEGTLGDAKFTVRMTDEGGRIGLNRAEEALLTPLITSLFTGGNRTTGLSKRDADQVAEIVDAILDWRDPDSLVRLHGAESEYYLGLRQPYRAKNGWFDSPEELLLVRGVTPDLYYGRDGVPGLKDIFSVYSKSASVNVRSAPPAVLQVFLGVDAAAAAELIATREAEGQGFLPLLQAQATAFDPQLATLLVDEEPRVVTLEARADTAEPENQSRVAVIVDLSSETAEGARVLRWIDRAPWTGTLPGGAKADS